MAAKKKEVQQTKTWTIFALLVLETKAFFVGTTSSNNLIGAYKHHYHGQIQTTATWIVETKKRGAEIDFFALDTVDGTKYDVTLYALIWANKLIESGYVPACGEIDPIDITSLSTQQREYYFGISGLDVSVILSPDKALTPNHGEAKARKEARDAAGHESGEHRLSIRLSHEEYMAIGQRALAQGLSPAAYAKTAILQRTPITVDLSVAYQAIEGQNQIVFALKNVLFGLYKTKTYSPDDMERIQTLCDRAESSACDLTDAYLAMCDTIRSCRYASLRDTHPYTISLLPSQREYIANFIYSDIERLKADIFESEINITIAATEEEERKEQLIKSKLIQEQKKAEYLLSRIVQDTPEHKSEERVEKAEDNKEDLA